MSTSTENQIVLPGDEPPVQKVRSKVELPVVTESNPIKKHISLMLISDGLKQAEKNLAEQEANIKKYTDQLQQLHSMRIASMAQKNLLEELASRIEELESITKPIK
jgi:hypothetical protein